MPYRFLAAKELGDLLRAISHPRRIQILEELRNGERDVGALAKALGIPHSGVSQHLMALRAHRIVSERREGRQVFYRLRAAKLAEWLVEGMDFLPEMDEDVRQLRKAMTKAKATWSNHGKPTKE